ncbi:MAG: bifunctional (p)ppGpp synthetase/guanosine-3',5'-bis(diphosphate) 3'-pyrophosphohydrolase [Bacilli bacterium]
MTNTENDALAPVVNTNKIYLHTFQELQELFFTYIKNEQDRELIKKAYLYAEKKHEGQYRKSGETYIHHLIEVAYILAQLQSGPTTIVAGLLHDVVEDTDTPISEIESLFGTDAANLVDSLTKIQRLKLSKRTQEEFEAEDHRKIFLGMARDIRVIIIKLADRLHNLRTLSSLKPERQYAIAKETLEVFAPIAHRLGMNKVKSELEDLSLKYVEPDIFNNISTLLDQKTRNRQKSLDSLKKRLADLLFQNKFEFEIESRVKSIYSIYKKIYIKMHNFDDIYDILALRIITATEINCYEILGLIHSIYKPIPGRFKDYIAVPKPNMYQSLHTTIVSGDGNVFEVQIRTREMDEIAETGVAAHWRYKEGFNYNAKEEQKQIEEQLHWFRDFVNMSSESSDNANEYIENLSKDIFSANVYVFTPKGKVIDLPIGSTPIDFAYRIHTRVGDQAIGALVNGTLVPLNYVLKTSDVVEIRTSTTSPGPNEGWLKFVKTNNAVSNIKKFLLKKNSEFLKDDKIDKGRDGIFECAKERGITDESSILASISTNKVLNYYHCSTTDDLFVAVANHNPLPSSVCDFIGISDKKPKFKFVSRERKIDNSMPVYVKNASGIAITLAKCCNPIPGDDIVGYITKGKGVTVHRANCPNIIHEKQRVIDVLWKEDLGLATYPVDIIIECGDRPGLLIDVMTALSTNKISVAQLNAKFNSIAMTTNINATIYVSDARSLTDIINVILNIKTVFNVKRVIH